MSIEANTTVVREYFEEKWDTFNPDTESEDSLEDEDNIAQGDRVGTSCSAPRVRLGWPLPVSQPGDTVAFDPHAARTYHLRRGGASSHRGGGASCLPGLNDMRVIRMPRYRQLPLKTDMK